MPLENEIASAKAINFRILVTTRPVWQSTGGNGPVACVGWSFDDVSQPSTFGIGSRLSDILWILIDSSFQLPT